MSEEHVVADEPTEAEVRAVVGPRADFYLRKWQASEGGGFNWAAFCLSGLWLPYRRMYRATAILYVLIILESIAEDVLFVGWLGWPQTPRSVERGVTAAVCWMCGGFGNGWYLAHVKRVVAAARVQQPDESQRRTLLAVQGGTSLLRAVGWFVLFVVAIVGATMAAGMIIERAAGAG